MQRRKCQKNLDAFYSLSSGTAELLRDVYERETDQCLDGLILVFTTKVLVFEANEDDDTLSVYSKSAAAFDSRGLSRKTDSRIWQPLVGKAFGWGWVTVNQQGYCDGALLSFNGLTPTVLLEVTASSITINGVVPFQVTHAPNVSVPATAARYQASLSAGISA
jgi:hypothetical protein